MGGKVQSEVAREAAVGKRYRLALFDPLSGERKKWEGPVYHQGSATEHQARIAIEEYNRLTADDSSVTLCLAAFEWTG